MKTIPLYQKDVLLFAKYLEVINRPFTSSYKYRFHRKFGRKEFFSCIRQTNQMQKSFKKINIFQQTTT